MKYDSTKTNLGNVRIHKGVITSMAAIAALETEGVAGLYSSIRDEIIRLFIKDYKPGIKVLVDKTEDITLSVSIMVKYGYNIAKVASKVQENIRLSIDKVAEVALRDININVKGIERVQSE